MLATGSDGKLKANLLIVSKKDHIKSGYGNILIFYLLNSKRYYLA